MNGHTLEVLVRQAPEFGDLRRGLRERGRIAVSSGSTKKLDPRGGLEDAFTKLILVLGGARSGKSSYAERRAETTAKSKAYIATCPNIDGELALRIEKHKASRAGKGWVTVEEPLLLDQAIGKSRDFTVVLVDCLTLWVNNLLYQAELAGEKLTEGELEGRMTAVIDAARTVRGTVIFVSNEVGGGLVPADETSRLYRDLMGRCNQLVAANADEVVLMTAGIPNHLKKE